LRSLTSQLGQVRNHPASQAATAPLPHAGKAAEADTYQITVEDGIAFAAPRTTSRRFRQS